MLSSASREAAMGKKSKGMITVAKFADGKAGNFIPGWIGGTLTSPEAQKVAKNRLKETLKTRILSFEAARRSTVLESEAPAPGR
jgi:hypothetical protein